MRINGNEPGYALHDVASKSMGSGGDRSHHRAHGSRSGFCGVRQEKAPGLQQSNAADQTDDPGSSSAARPSTAVTCLPNPDKKVSLRFFL